MKTRRWKVFCFFSKTRKASVGFGGQGASTSPLGLDSSLESAPGCLCPVSATPPALRLRLYCCLFHTRIFEGSQCRVAQQIMAAARLLVKPGMSQPRSSARLLERGGEGRQGGREQGAVH
ncbi:hypothetical protein XENORESO_000621 [Xenotaenia resolanae]|uniref:Uncharacterized protein n=1 Tax=Xenotaenia resolanae TaxID=208358 RepID=A0ABV0W6B0_9TELE